MDLQRLIFVSAVSNEFHHAAAEQWRGFTSDISAATAALEEAAALIDKEAEPLRWADISQVLVRFLLDQAIWDRAEELVSDIIDIREEHQGENHPAVAAALLLRMSEAEPLIRRAIAIEEKNYGINHPSIANPLNTLAILLTRTGRSTEAESLLRRALELLMRFAVTTGNEHPNFRKIKDNYDALLRRIGR